jgi:hypothetical protein
VHLEDHAELMGRIHTALRHGDLDAESVLELACVLEESGVSTPVTRELLERPAGEPSVADLTRLGGSLLRAAHFEPTFALDPTLWTTLESALAVVERDVRTVGFTGTLRLIIPDWDGGRNAWVEYKGEYHGNGIPPFAGEDAQQALVAVADSVQEVIMELVWTVWPVCATHDRGAHAGDERDLVGRRTIRHVFTKERSVRRTREASPPYRTR